MVSKKTTVVVQGRLTSDISCRELLPVRRPCLVARLYGLMGSCERARRVATLQADHHAATHAQSVTRSHGIAAHGHFVAECVRGQSYVRVFSAECAAGGVRIVHGVGQALIAVVPQRPVLGDRRVHAGGVDRTRAVDAARGQVGDFASMAVRRPDVRSVRALNDQFDGFAEPVSVLAGYRPDIAALRHIERIAGVVAGPHEDITARQRNRTAGGFGIDHLDNDFRLAVLPDDDLVETSQRIVGSGQRGRRRLGCDLHRRFGGRRDRIQKLPPEPQATEKQSQQKQRADDRRNEPARPPVSFLVGLRVSRDLVLIFSQDFFVLIFSENLSLIGYGTPS